MGSRRPLRGSARRGRLLYQESGFFLFGACQVLLGEAEGGGEEQANHDHQAQVLLLAQAEHGAVLLDQLLIPAEGVAEDGGQNSRQDDGIRLGQPQVVPHLCGPVSGQEVQRTGEADSQDAATVVGEQQVDDEQCQCPNESPEGEVYPR